MEHKKGDINIIVKVVLLLFAFRHAVNIANNIILLNTPEYTTYQGIELKINDHTACTYNLLLSVVFIIVMIMVMKRKRKGVIAFFVLQAINTLLQISGSPSRTAEHLGAVIVSCLMFWLIMLIRKDGVSAMKMCLHNGYMPKEEEGGALTEIVEPQDKSMMVNETVNETVNEREEESINISTMESMEQEKPKERGLRFKPSKRIWWIALACLVAGGISWGYYLNNTTEARYKRATELWDQGDVKRALPMLVRLGDEDDHFDAKVDVLRIYLKDRSGRINHRRCERYVRDCMEKEPMVLDWAINYYSYGNRKDNLMRDKYVKLKEQTREADILKDNMAVNTVRLRALYDALKNEEDLRTFDEFSAAMDDPKRRKGFHDALKDKYDFRTFEEFEAALGYDKPLQQSTIGSASSQKE